jgi:hypothetical protein
MGARERHDPKPSRTRAIPLQASPLATPRGPSPVDTPPPGATVSARSRLSFPVHLDAIDTLAARRALSS